MPRSKIGFLTRQCIYKCLDTKIERKPSPPLAIALQHLVHVPALVHVLGLVHAQAFHFNLAHGLCFCVQCDYETMDGGVLLMLHHPSPHKRREPSG